VIYCCSCTVLDSARLRGIWIDDLLETIVTGFQPEFGAGFFQNICKILAGSDINFCSAERRVQYYNVGGHVPEALVEALEAGNIPLQIF